jgi:hypothetical protein
MNIYGTFKPVNELRRYLKSETKTVKFSDRIDDSWVFDFLIFLSIDSFNANLIQLRKPVFLETNIVICDSIHKLMHTNLTILDFSLDLKSQMPTSNLRMKDNLIDDLIKKATDGSLLNKLMTLIYSIPKHSTQKNVKIACINWLFNQHLDVNDIFNSLNVQRQLKSDIIELLMSKAIEPYRRAFDRFDISNPDTLKLAKECKVDIFELNYGFAVYRDKLKNEARVN